MSTLQALIVDDDPFMVRLIETVISSRFSDQLSFDTTSDSAEARELLRGNHYDLLIADLDMESIDGLELIEYARRCNAWTRVVMLTGAASVERVTAALALGASDYLAKPVNPSLLLEIVQQHILQQQRWQQALRDTIHTARVA